MAVKVQIPVGLLKMTDNQRFVEVEADDVRRAMDELNILYPGIRDKFYNDDGSLKGFVRIYVNRKDIRAMEGDRTSLSAGDELILLPALSGG